MLMVIAYLALKIGCNECLVYSCKPFNNQNKSVIGKCTDNCGAINSWCDSVCDNLTAGQSVLVIIGTFGLVNTALAVFLILAVT